jgi:hypothetical protein
MRYAAIDPSGRIAVQGAAPQQETCHAMTAAVATLRADLDPAPAVSGLAPAVPCAAAAGAPAPAAGQPVDMPQPHAARAGTA